MFCPPDLGPNCLQRLQGGEKSPLSTCDEDHFLNLPFKTKVKNEIKLNSASRSIFTLKNSENPDVLQQSAIFYQDLHCLLG